MFELITALIDEFINNRHLTHLKIHRKYLITDAIFFFNTQLRVFKSVQVNGQLSFIDYGRFLSQYTLKLRSAFLFAVEAEDYQPPRAQMCSAASRQRQYYRRCFSLQITHGIDSGCHAIIFLTLYLFRRGLLDASRSREDRADPSRSDGALC